jgi:hypothetical protein
MKMAKPVEELLKFEEDSMTLFRLEPDSQNEIETTGVDALDPELGITRDCEPENEAPCPILPPTSEGEPTVDAFTLLPELSEVRLESNV